MKTFKERYLDEIGKFESGIRDYTHEIIEKFGYINPTVFGLVQREGKMAITILFGLEKYMVNEKDKIKAAEAVRAMNDEIKPVAIAFASEGVLMKEGETDKINIVHIQFETYDQVKNIIWNKDNESTLKYNDDISTDWQNKNEDNNSIFYNLLKENYTELANILKETLGHELN